MSSPAEALFQAWLDEREEGRQPDPGAFCSGQPEGVRVAFTTLVQDYEDLVQVLQHGPDLRSGAVFGRFRLRRRLGRGATGVVWEAEELQLNRPVALKILHPLLALSEHARERFQREAEAAARLEHAGLAQVHGAGETDGFFWIAQELVGNGRTLWDWIELERRSLAQADFRAIGERFKVLAEALSAAHRVGVLHRDIKPGNILVAEDGGWKLVDFGLARLDDAVSLTLSLEEGGTPAYMAPEQITGGVSATDERSEVFSFGATLYEVLGLARAFQASSREQAVHRILHDRPASLSRIRAGIPDELCLVVHKALERERERRYSTMAELAEDLGRFVQGLPVHARPPTLVRKTKAWVRREPWKACVLAMGATALLAVSFLWTRASQNLRDTVEAARLAGSFVDLTDPDRAASQRMASFESLTSLGELAADRLGDFPEVQAKILLDVGRGLRWAERFADALPPLERAVELAKRRWGEHSEQALEAEVQLAWCLGRVGQHERAREILEEILRLAPESREDLRAYALNRLGQAWWEIANQRKDDGMPGEDQARARARDSWVETETILEGIGADLPALQALNNLDLGIFYSTWAGIGEGNNEAETYLQRAYQGYLDNFGPFHPELIYILVARSDLLGRLGRYAEAAQELHQAWKISSKVHGESHPQTLEWRLYYIDRLERSENWTEAERERLLMEAEG